jgi:biopolymer transport protein ExbD
MLIFFIVTAVFVREPGFEVERPVASTAMLPGAASMIVAITAENDVWIDRRQVALEAVGATLERLAAENPESGVIIQPDRRAENRALIAVMDAAKQARITRVTIAARAP